MALDIGKYLSVSPVLVANFKPSTWVAILLLIDYAVLVFFGADLPQYRHLISLFATVYLASLLCYGLSINLFGFPNHYLPKQTMGKYTSLVPNVDASIPARPGDNGLVVFVVGSQQNHPFGVFSPGVIKVGAMFNKMWKELESNPEEWGFIGRTDKLISQSPSQGNRLFYISYWRSVEDVHRFNLSHFHKDALKWWNGNVRNMPHLGIFHELYEVAPHKWETVYGNFHPSGPGHASSGEAKTSKAADSFVPVPMTSTMFTRMKGPKVQEVSLVA